MKTERDLPTAQAKAKDRGTFTKKSFHHDRGERIKPITPTAPLIMIEKVARLV